MNILQETLHTLGKALGGDMSGTQLESVQSTIRHYAIAAAVASVVSAAVPGVAGLVAMATQTGLILATFHERENRQDHLLCYYILSRCRCRCGYRCVRGCGCYFIYPHLRASIGRCRKCCDWLYLNLYLRSYLFKGCNGYDPAERND